MNLRKLYITALSLLAFGCLEALASSHAAASVSQCRDRCSVPQKRARNLAWCIANCDPKVLEQGGIPAATAQSFAPIFEAAKKEEKAIELAQAGPQQAPAQPPAAAPLPAGPAAHAPAPAAGGGVAPPAAPPGPVAPPGPPPAPAPPAAAPAPVGGGIPAYNPCNGAPLQPGYFSGTGAYDNIHAHVPGAPNSEVFVFDTAAAANGLIAGLGNAIGTTGWSWIPVDAHTPLQTKTLGAPAAAFGGGPQNPVNVVVAVNGGGPNATLRCIEAPAPVGAPIVLAAVLAPAAPVPPPPGPAPAPAPGGAPAHIDRPGLELLAAVEAEIQANRIADPGGHGLHPGVDGYRDAYIDELARTAVAITGTADPAHSLTPAEVIAVKAALDTRMTDLKAAVNGMLDYFTVGRPPATLRATLTTPPGNLNTFLARMIGQDIISNGHTLPAPARTYLTGELGLLRVSDNEARGRRPGNVAGGKLTTYEAARLPAIIGGAAE